MSSKKEEEGREIIESPRVKETNLEETLDDEANGRWELFSGGPEVDHENPADQKGPTAQSNTYNNGFYHDHKPVEKGKAKKPTTTEKNEDEVSERGGCIIL